ncbi:MAG: M14 family metallopeptidase [Chitinophagaceae bacterium]
MKYLLLIVLSFSSIQTKAQKWQTFYEKSGGKETPPYPAIISYYQSLSRAFPKMTFKAKGMSDAGYPLHLITYTNDGTSNFADWHRKGKLVLMILNGIHPGEPDGIDASMMLICDLVTGKKKIPDNIALAVIPVYNIGGCLNRSEYFRVDQDGPVAFGSRGNSQNLDLNRDFIKCDSKEARSFTEIFHAVDPDVFVDNHVSNGADYQHIMTLISSQHNKLGGSLGEFMNKSFEPGLYKLMKSRGYDLVPYVNFFGDTPDSGWPEFFDSPRYSSGYATLWNTFGFTTETHMLKSYNKRVMATYALMECFIDYSSSNASKMRALRAEARVATKSKNEFPTRWAIDSSKHSEIVYKGFQAGRKPSEVSGLPRLFYDRGKPYDKIVPFYNTYKETAWIKKPEAYIIPQGWWKVIDLLKFNGVKMRPLTKDSIVEVVVSFIDDYKTAPRQYEGHHANSDVKLRKETQKIAFRKGDIIIPMNQDANRFLIETLEPESNDSYFAWNFFDPILGSKEGYSNYVFEDDATEYLKAHPDLKKVLDERKAADPAFAKNARAQLDFVYKNSPYAEPGFMRYPVYRIEKQH